MRPLSPEIAEDTPRANILACVERTPGAHLRGIERMANLPLGQVLYHLDRLERMGLVSSRRDSGFRRYFLASSIGRHEKRYLGALRLDAPRRVILALLRDGPLPHKVLLQTLGVAGSTLSFHLRRMMDAGILVRERDGPVQRYRIVEPDLARQELIYWRESFADPEVDSYVRDALAALPPLAPPATPEVRVPVSS